MPTAATAAPAAAHPARTWWKSALVYQIYPASFSDANGDGVGDLRGIAQRLDYLKDLGADVLWLSPVYKSPQKDMGYDISDYTDIDPRYGTLRDWDDLVKGIHDRGMKIMMDLVVNHTSEEHEWFRESRSSKTSPKRDWYIWRPPRCDAAGNRLPPNNWKAVFQGSVWEWDEHTQEYYLHLYLKEQPDLNWETPAVRDAVWDAMRFWLDRGTDGFRMDVINLISKVPGLPDAPVVNADAEYQPAQMYFANGPRVHEYIQEMNSKVLSKYDVLTVGEAPHTRDMHALAKYVLPENQELHMVFHFELMKLDAAGAARDEPYGYRPWKLPEMKEIITRWQRFLREEGFWNAIYIENHDQARSVSRFASDAPQWRAKSAKMLALLQIAQAGTLYVYQGEEIGMVNFPASWGFEEYKDEATRKFYEMKRRQKIAAAGDGKEPDMADVMYGLHRKARDNARTPVQWDATANAGFTTGTPWMRVNEDYLEWNVAKQLHDPESVFSFWKRVLKLRKENEVLVYGDFELIDEDNEDIFAFKRTLDGTTALVLLSFTEREVRFAHARLGELASAGSTLLVSNYEPARGDETISCGLGDADASQFRAEGRALEGDSVILRGFEGRIYVTT